MLLKKKLNKGFTLIELLAVIVILGLLIGIAFPAVSSYINESKEDTYNLHEADMKTAASNMMSQCVQNGTEGCVPSNGESRTVYLSQLIDEKYSEVIRDPEDTDLYCDAEKSYVVVTNSNNNVVELDYQVCLVCSQYRSEACGEVPPTNKCDKEIDPTEPECGESVGSSTIWTNKDRVVSIPCIDNEGGCGCSQSTFYKTFTEDGKTGTITISDKAGNTKECTVNTYIDKEAPTCEIEVVDYGTYSSSTGWYGGSAPVIKITSKTDELSGVATYGIGTSKNNHDFNKLEEYKANAGISMIYGYVKDNAGNVGTCYVEVKYDSVIPTGELNYGYQVYPKDDISTKSGSTITLNTITGEFGKILGIKVYLSSNSTGMSSTTVKNGSNTLATRTISSGVTEMLYTFSEADVYNNLTIDMRSSTNVNKVEKIEIITDHVMTSSTKFYTNQDVKVYIVSKDSLSGKALYSFDYKATWQEENEETFTKNTQIGMVTKDAAGNDSEVIESEINNIDKLAPKDAVFATNGGTYTISVGQTQLSVSTKITVDDAAATSSYAKSGVRNVYFAWTTNTTQPTVWTLTANNETLSRTSTGGSNYLWIKTIDKAGNETITRSNDFNVGYQITYNCNGGSGCPADQRKVYNTTLKLSSTEPTRSGYEFLGWGTTAATHTVTYASGANYTANAADELFAIWRKTLTFTFNGNGATLNATSKSCYIYNAETNCNITLPTITRSGFTIEGFNTSASATSETSGWTSGATVSVSTSTTKTWYAITYKDKAFTFYANGATLSKTSASCTIRNSATTCNITLPTITRSGFTISGFSSNASATSEASGWTSGATVSVDKDTTASWYAITSKGVSFTFNGNGATLNKTSASCTIRNSATTCSITLPTITRSGFTITGFNTSSSSTSAESGWTSGATVSVGTSTSASWYAITSKGLSFTFNANGATLNKTSASCTIRNNATTCSITLPTITRSGFTITGFNTSSSSTSATSGWTSGATVSVGTSTSASWYAITSKGVTITFNKNGAASIGATSKSCTIQNNNSTCSVTSPTITGSTNTPTVVGWNTSSSGTTSQWNQNTAGNVSSNATYYAITRSSSATYYITHNGNGATSGSTANTSCTINATYNGTARGSSCTAYLGTNGFSRSGYSFKGWSTNSSASSGSSNGTAVTLSGNVTYYATWQQDITLSDVCNSYSGDTLFGTGKGNKTGTLNGSTIQNYGTWYTGLYEYHCYSGNGCTRSNGYDRICVDDGCGPYKGYTAKQMKELSSSCSSLGTYWCSCSSTGQF